MLVPRHHDVDRLTRSGGDKKLDANVKAAVGVQLLISLTVRIGPRYITA
jgi:hypothetical protein